LNEEKLESDLKSELIKAVQFSIEGNWNRAHDIVQRFNDSYASWIHAVLHKIEGDEANSRYWYARTFAEYEDFESSQDELIHLRELLHKL